ncbi:nitrate- and nitrite sensing domain-containing protein [Streptomyces flavofungini]|uniref:nitrate- and nitrite sensing domain-containing protein n=1 Tax=Streptomyces flavofungini TaxID=68200 RepID=UPI00199D2161|nr:nitrate- and nitrite sensing domain-containing protein [Streptomyces flavofungini]GHC47158.1 histidine kinase [Streptomyces flavofungini]
MAVAVVAAAVAGAGAPVIVTATSQLNESQSLVTLAELTQQSITLSHSLADERDEVTAYIAAGRPDGKSLSESHSARVDRSIEELREAAADANTNTSVTAELRRDLAGLASVRRAALTGRTTALDAHKAYAKAIAELHGLTRELAEKLPPRAGSGAHALADLDHAVDQAGSARGLLLAALAVPRPAATGSTVDPVTGLPTSSGAEDSEEDGRRDGLSAAAQQAHVRELAALADFQDTAPAKARATYDSTVTGNGVTTAEQYLARLTDRPRLSGADQRLDRKKLDSALSARIEAMRGAENALADARTQSLGDLRDDDVTALEIRIALVGVLLLVAVGVCMGTARSLTRPLAALRRGSERVATAPAAEEPVRFTGRDDEFAAVVRSVNALHGHAVGLQERLTTLEADRKHLIGQRQTMADARQEMADERDALRAELAEASVHLERVRRSIHGTFVNLALRTLGLVERQLAVIEGLEEREQDPDRLATLFKLDHFATVTRRHSENLLVLAGAEHGHQHAGPVPLVDVVRAAVSEIERYERVTIATLPPHAHIAGFAADDISHLVAELLENATSFSPPDAAVEVSGWLLENGEVMLSVQDEGIGVGAERLDELNARLAEFSPDDVYDQESGDGLGLGLYVVARLAARHGARVRLREQKQGGVAAVVVLPDGILAAPPAAGTPGAVPAAPAEAPLVHLPGSEAEANSNVLPSRSGDRDPLIAAAETTLELLAPPVPADHPDDAEPHARPDDEVRPEQEARPKPDAQSPSERDAALAAEAMPDGLPEGGGPSEAEAVREPAAPSQDTAAVVVPDAAAGDVPGAATAAEPDTDTARARDADAQVLTAKGLPKRTPRISPTAGSAVPKPRPAVDAEELRRRLGGFQQGAISGRRDVAAELARTEERSAHTEESAEGHRAADVPGDPVEEASS